jgi:hypothetical protein
MFLEKKLKLGEKKKEGLKLQKIKKKMGPSCHILREKNLNPPHVQTNFNKLPIYMKNPNFLNFPL